MRAIRVLLAVAVIATAVGAALVLSSSPAAPVGPSSLTSSATSASSSPMPSVSESTSSAGAASASTSESQQLSGFLARNISAVSRFFDSIHAFTITIASGTAQQMNSTTQSWTYVGSPAINGTSYTEVSVSCSGSQPCEYSSPYTLWIADDGNIPTIQYGGNQYNYNYDLYSGGPTIGLEEMLVFSTAPYLSGSSSSEFAFNGTGSFQAGATRIPTYSWSLSSPITYSGTTVNQASVRLGVIPGGNVILIRFIGTGTSGGASVDAIIEVTSVTLA